MANWTFTIEYNMGPVESKASVWYNEAQHQNGRKGCRREKDRGERSRRNGPKERPMGILFLRNHAGHLYKAEIVREAFPDVG